MKMHFQIVIKGQDTLEQKFKKAVDENPTLHMDVIRSFAQTIMLALRLKEEDNISVESFRAGKVDEVPTENTQNEESAVVQN